MRRIVVAGGKRLRGEVRIGGSKNAALPILFGGIVTGEKCVFSNLPRVSDVLQTLEILKFLGARMTFFKNGDVGIDYAAVQPRSVPSELTGAIRGSTYLLGAMLARFGHAELASAGGCDFGDRPIDQHLMGFERLGAQVRFLGDTVIVEAPNGLCGATVKLAMPSVGATANLMLAATGAVGKTVICNAASEPHVAALGAFLSEAGASISQFSADTVRVFGNLPLHGTRYAIIPDMIEAGTYLALGMACGGPIKVTSICPEHLSALLSSFARMGGQVEIGDTCVTVSSAERYRNICVETGPYPAFPTDLHPQLAALMCIGGRATGCGSVTEQVFRSRFGYVAELCRMGADIKITDRTVNVYPMPLHAAAVRAPDLRGGVALLIAALAANGQSEITNAATIGRGYERLEAKLRALGASVTVD